MPTRHWQDVQTLLGGILSFLRATKFDVSVNFHITNDIRLEARNVTLYRILRTWKPKAVGNVCNISYGGLDVPAQGDVAWLEDDRSSYQLIDHTPNIHSGLSR